MLRSRFRDETSDGACALCPAFAAPLNYIAGNYIHLDHEGRVAASSGVSYLWLGTRVSVDALFGTGLRDDLTLPNGNVIPNGDHTPSYTRINFGLSHAFDIGSPGPLTARFDVINVVTARGGRMIEYPAAGIRSILRIRVRPQKCRPSR
jgi:hypothetical protein